MATNIVIPDTVLKRLNDLPKEVRIKFWEQLERLIANPSYPGLRNEKLKGTDQWAFSVTMNYRALMYGVKWGLSLPLSEPTRKSSEIKAISLDPSANINEPIIAISIFVN